MAGTSGTGSEVDTGIVDLEAWADELSDKASAGSAGRAARTLPHPVDGLRQTVIALRAGAAMQEHESPGPATLLVLRGRARLVTGEASLELGPHQISPVPAQRHSVEADADTVVVLSVCVRDRAPAR